MTAYVRRAGADLARIVERATNPAAEPDRALRYAKDVNGVTQVFVMASDGTPHQISGIEANIWDRLASPNANDDEFDSAILNPAWSFTSTFTGTPDPYAAFAAGDTRMDVHTGRRSWLRLQPPGDGVDNKRLHKPIVYPANMFVWMRASMSQRIATVTNTDAGIQLMLSATAAGVPDVNNAVFMALNEADASEVALQFQKIDGGILTVVQEGFNCFAGVTNAQPYDSVGIQKIGTTYHGWAFTPGGHALHLGSTILATAIDRVAINFGNAAIASPGNMIMGVDFVRFVASGTFLP